MIKCKISLRENCIAAHYLMCNQTFCRTGRNWRFHKELKVWIMLEDPSASNVQKAMISPDLSGALPKASGSVGGGKASTPISNLSQSKGNNTYAVFDPQTWTKISKELPIKAEHLEDRFLTISDTKLSMAVK